ncbi:hypothetical protein G3O08_13920 [Cryomorpha ignava]|uniref:Uncharacterized protein n=1 Tax=Cryomorpha ignava TaxID=101383 RepID=A0A7K3WU85_9FLAO|nr:hypothetical protein [Cryomorpha ignava]NEN24601.1 hypothetical protein [Cryomorpha ignava]
MRAKDLNSFFFAENETTFLNLDEVISHALSLVYMLIALPILNESKQVFKPSDGMI